MQEMLQSLADKETIVPVLAITLGCLVGAIWIVSATIHAILVSRHREQTKREVAAYVAEGTIDAKTAVALLNAGPLDAGQKIAKAPAGLFDGSKPAASA